MKKWISVLFLILGAIYVSADPNIDLLKAVSESNKYADADQVILFDNTTVDVQESGLSFVNIHKLIRIQSSRGAKNNSVITFGYDPLSAYVEIQKVKIYRKDGSIEELDVNTVMDYPAPARAIYWGAREKMIEVGRLEIGDAIEVFLFRKGFTYALLKDDDDRYIPPMRGHYYDIVEFWSNVPVLKKSYQVSIPADKTFQYKFYNGEVKSSAELRDGKMIYTFCKKDIVPFVSEPGMVSPSDVAPKLLMSTSPDWYAKSLWFYGVNEDYGAFESTPEIDAKVAKIVKDAKTEMDTISLLTHWVADEMRYSGISMGPGEGFTLHKGEMNFADRCGVCKDKAGMLITMLRSAGFESYAAMTMAGSRIDYIPADQFNHSVTIVKLRSGEYKILDPTWVPFLRELWSSAEQQQNYLMGLPEGADLSITPISPPENHYFRVTVNSKISKNGTLTASYEVTAEGQSDGSVRGLFTRSMKSNWKNQIEREVLKISPLAKITSMDFGEPYKYLDGPILIKLKIEIPDYAIVTEDEIIYTPIIHTGIMNRGMAHLYTNTVSEEKKYNFRDRCSRLVELKETITIPAKYNLTNTIEESFGDAISSFEATLTQKGKKISFYEKISLGKRIYEVEDWPMYRKVVMKQNELINQPLVLSAN